MVFSIATIIGYIFMKNKPPFIMSGLFALVVFFVLHSFLGVFLYAFYDGMWEKFEVFVKSLIFFIFAVLLLRKKEHFEAILMFLCIALCFFGVMEGIKVLLSGGGHKIQGIHGPLGDNNKVALGLNMTIPLILYLVTQMENKYVKLALKGTAFLCVMAIIGTASRGGFIGLVFMAFYYWWKNGKKLSIAFSVLLVGAIAASLMPSAWFERMDSIANSGENSPMVSRVTSWKINYLAGLDHPFAGHGFDATAARIVWQNYVYDLNTLNWGVDTPIPQKGFVAHSIYFQVLGNQGFVGLFLFLAILFVTFSKINSLRRHYYNNDTWQSHLLTAVKVSIATYCICGAALSAAYFELLYFLIAVVLCLEIAAKTGVNLKITNNKSLG
jgi:probable O-glycosylation ligase (exosortase A-associated)